MDIKVVFDDECLVVVEKVANLLVVPAPGKDRNLTSLLSKQLNQKVHPCHRLDVDTTGLIIYAKSLDVQHQMMDQFRERKVNKEYTAFVQGIIKKNSFRIKGSVKPRGKPAKMAETRIRVIERGKNYTIVKVFPVTGRSNQIRIHLDSIGHPIIGERKYTIAKKWPLKHKRTCLHADFIEFIHPLSQDKVRLKSQLPMDMKISSLKPNFAIK